MHPGDFWFGAVFLVGLVIAGCSFMVAALIVSSALDDDEEQVTR